MSTETDAMLTCAGCEEVFIEGDETECDQCDGVFCTDCANSCSRYVKTQGEVERVCVFCVDEAWEIKREKRGSWDNE